MQNIYIQISRDTKKSKQMRELALDEGAKGIELRKLQDDLYKRTEFKKKYLKARGELNARERNTTN